MTGDPVGGPPDNVIIIFKNHTDKLLHADIVFSLCPTTDSSETNFDAVANVNPNSCASVGFFVSPGNVFRVAIVGDVDLDAKLLEVTVIGQRSSDFMNEPTMFFRDDDFVLDHIKEPI